VSLVALPVLFSDAGAVDKIRVTCTTGPVGDLVARLGGARAQVTTLMGPGSDPHRYEASEEDLARLAGAEIVFCNGLGLEAGMADVLAATAKDGIRVIGVADRFDRSLLVFRRDDTPDPHVWLDAKVWVQAVPVVLKGLISADPESQEYFEANALALLEELADLDQWCRARLAEIPAERRVLVTAHDGFGCFGRAYGIETFAPADPEDVERIVDLVVARDVRVVFPESSGSPSSLESVVQGCRERGHEVRVGGTLHSGAMGETGTPAETWGGMLRLDVETIVGALR